MNHKNYNTLDWPKSLKENEPTLSAAVWKESCPLQNLRFHPHCRIYIHRHISGPIHLLFSCFFPAKNKMQSAFNYVTIGVVTFQTSCIIVILMDD